MTALTAIPAPDPNRLASQGGAQVWWLGQAGFLIVQNGLRIVIDPYLSDSLAEKYQGTAFPHRRMMPPPVAPDGLRNVDWVLCTHAHTDHMDPGTLPALLAANPAARALVPRAEVEKALARGIPADRLVTIDAGESLDLGGVTCIAIPAAHEQMTRTEAGHLYLGYVLAGGGTSLWHSGDTIPWPGQAEWLLPFRVDLALLPVNGRDAIRAANGVPGNLTLPEALLLADGIGARAMLGHHFGLFDFNTLDPEEGRYLLAALPHRTRAELVRPATAYHVTPAERAEPAILLVCKGNICRSPTAGAILAQLLPGARIDSAAIMDWNIGRPVHDQTRATAAWRGIDLSAHVARQIVPADFDRFDLILGMDDENEAALRALCPAQARAAIGLLGAYLDPGSRTEIQDPWGGTDTDFELAYDRIAAACDGLSRLVRAADRKGRTEWTSD